MTETQHHVLHHDGETAPVHASLAPSPAVPELGPVPPSGAPAPRPMTRRRLLEVAGMTIGIVGGGLALGKLIQPFFQAAPPVRLGIAPGSQPLWRYFVARNPALLGSLGYVAEFKNFGTEDELRQAYRDGSVDVVASLTPAVASYIESGLEAQLFLPAAWLREGYPIVVPVESPIRSLADLRGRQVATFPLNHPGLAYWRALLLHNEGFRLEDVRPVETVVPEQMLIEKSVDAAAIGSTQWAALRKSALSTGPGQAGARNEFRLVSDLNAEWRRARGLERLPIFAAYFARPSFVQQHRAFVDSYIRLHVDVLRDWQTRQDEVLDVIAKEPTGPPLSNEENGYTGRYLGYDDVDPSRAYFDDEDVADYAFLAGLLAACGYLSAAPRAVEPLFYRGSGDRG